jgi:cobalt-zinc-cadmium efflux system outer membrane protein
LILAGCTFPVRQNVDDLICNRGNVGYDTNSNPDGHLAPPPIVPRKEPKPGATLVDRLTVQNVPGSDAPFIVWPDPKASKEAKEAAVKKFFPPLPRLQPDPDFPAGPDGKPLTLADLQRIAFANSPLLKQAASDIEAARGAAIQAGAYPNPTIGYESSSAGPGGGPNVGVFVSQQVKLWGKLKVAQAAAMMDLTNAEIAYRRAETDLLASVRGNYYAVLVAQESIRANRGLAELTDEVYRVLVDRLRGGEAAPYEPLQLKVFSEQTRASLDQARNARLLAWRQLAASMGVPHMPATALAGNIHREVPRIDFEKALAHVLTKHTDMLATAATIEKARHNLRLAQLTPYPDVNVQLGMVNDLTPPGPSRLTNNVQISFPLPIFDQNKGGIQQSQAALVRASEEPHRVNADLTARFSEAYRRYEENRKLIDRYQKGILPAQVQTFRGAIKRYFGGEVGAVAYIDLVSSEQNLISVVGAYLPLLQAQWQAVVDVSSLLQTDQLYLMADEVASEPEIDFLDLLKMPCCHPCTPMVPTPTRDSFRMTPVAGTVSPSLPPVRFATPVAAPSEHEAPARTRP